MMRVRKGFTSKFGRTVRVGTFALFDLLSTDSKHDPTVKEGLAN